MIDFPSLSCRVITERAAPQVELTRTCRENSVSFALKNNGTVSVRIREVVVFHGEMPYPANTRFYGEGFNMLSQYCGTLEHFESAGALTDKDHYRLPQKPGFFTCYNLLLLAPSGGELLLAGFSSCRRFSNEIRFNPKEIEFAIDCCNLELFPGEIWELEDFFFEYGMDRKKLFDDFGGAIQKNHPRMPGPDKIAGWCSWYGYGLALTENDILDNMRTMREKFPEFRFVQIDDGYENKLGDWLTPHPNFSHGIQELLQKIKASGLEPAIWISPFIAEEKSQLFLDHPEWFIHDEDGKPLPASKYSFGGWRDAPWYMLDCTIPEVLDHLRSILRVMREEWHCRYFKMDGTMWGCMPFGNLRNPSMTYIEAYRAGMKAVADGAGKDAILLGCNAPMWPSLGTCNVMRTTSDIFRDWPCIKRLARECFFRNWQNGRLWLNDPDCLVLENLRSSVMGPDGAVLSTAVSDVTPQEFSFHKAHILASGGALLSGDRLPELSGESIRTIEKIAEYAGYAADFEDSEMRYGKAVLPNGVFHFFFNWDDGGSVEYRLPPHTASLRDFWTEEALASSFSIFLPPRSARVLFEEKSLK